MIYIIQINSILLLILLTFVKFNNVFAAIDCNKDLSNNDMMELVKSVVPLIDRNKMKGDAGRICIIGGSLEYTGPPYMVAISSLRTGADVVVILTTDHAAPMIKLYGPELIVLPYLNKRSTNKIGEIIKKMDVVIIGPGLGNDYQIMKLVSEIILLCRYLKKALVIDSDGLFLLSTNVTWIKQYPAPGVMLLPNQIESEKLMESMERENIPGYTSLGKYIYVLQKGRTDIFLCNNTDFHWSLNEGGSGRRVGGQGDILTGVFGTLFNWAIKSRICEDKIQTHMMAGSVAGFGAAKLTRKCNEKAYRTKGRSMLSTDMVNEIHSSFKHYFELFVNLYDR